MRSAFTFLKQHSPPLLPGYELPVKVLRLLDLALPGSQATATGTRPLHPALPQALPCQPQRDVPSLLPQTPGPVCAWGPAPPAASPQAG